MRSSLVLVGIAALLSQSSSARAANKKHPFTVDDLLAMQRVDEPVLSPDGKTIAYSVRTTDVEANLGRTDVWLVAVASGDARRLTASPEKDGSPAWSPDGHWVYFLSTRSGSSQVWRISPAGGEAEPVTQLPVDVSVFRVVDDRLVLGVDVYPELAALEETAKRDEAQQKSKMKARAYDELLFRHWDQWDSGKRSHLLVWKAGKTIDLMKGARYDAPTHPSGDASELAISRDGKTLVFCAKDDGRRNAWSTNDDVWSVPLDGSRKPERLTGANLAWDGEPVFSPDGTTLAYLAMDRPGFEADRHRFVLYDWATKKTRSLAAKWDRSPSDFAWSADGKAIFATADHLGNRALFRIDAQTGDATVLGEAGMYDHPMALPDGGVAYTRNTLSMPNELFARHGAKEEPLTHHNDARVASIEWGKYEPFTFKGAHGDEVHAWLVRPAGHTGAKVPVAFLIHGGPQGSFGNDFHYRWNPELFAGHGYAAIMVDFHGSTGYGQAFTDAISRDWGGAPFEDLMKGLDAALVKYPFLDGNRVAALGASYGGYMINWINGHTDRFKALVCHDGNLDELMAYFDTEELWFPEWEHGGLPWEHPADYEKNNPVAFVKNWKTPELVIHGGQDFRVVDTQGMATFTALQRKNITSRFVYFPEENHWILRPQNTKRWHEEVFSWIDRFTKQH